jgi:hypothetical protein
VEPPEVYPLEYVVGFLVKVWAAALKRVEAIQVYMCNLDLFPGGYGIRLKNNKSCDK